MPGVVDVHASPVDVVTTSSYAADIPISTTSMPTASESIPISQTKGSLQFPDLSNASFFEQEALPVGDIDAIPVGNALKSAVQNAQASSATILVTVGSQKTSQNTDLKSVQSDRGTVRSSETYSYPTNSTALPIAVAAGPVSALIPSESTSTQSVLTTDTPIAATSSNSQSSHSNSETSNPSSTTHPETIRTKGLDSTVSNAQIINTYHTGTPILSQIAGAQPEPTAVTQPTAPHSRSQSIFLPDHDLPSTSIAVTNSGNSNWGPALLAEGVPVSVIDGSSTSLLPHGSAIPVPGQALAHNNEITINGSQSSSAPNGRTLPVETSMRTLGPSATTGVGSISNETVAKFTGNALGAGDGLWSSSMLLLIGVVMLFRL